jgi:hypothetical protein
MNEKNYCGMETKALWTSFQAIRKVMISIYCLERSSS